jgi:hypothetical protein
MNASRAVLMVVGINLVAVWAAAAAGGRAAATSPLVPPQAVADEGVSEARAAMLAAAGRLEAHARRDVSPALVRDPFRFGAEARPAGRRTEAPPEPAEATDAAVPAAPEPDIVLQGMAASAEGGAIVRTAILRAGDELVLATIGMRIGGRYDVVALTDETVELEDVVDHARRTCRMK